MTNINKASLYTDIRCYYIEKGLAYYDKGFFVIGSLTTVMEELMEFEERQSKLREEQKRYLKW